MRKACYHSLYYSDWAFWETPPEPTPEEINRDRLWKCRTCSRWCSLIGAKGIHFKEVYESTSAL